MQCPHCQYQDDWIDDEGDYRQGDKGNFFVSPVTLSRPETHRYYKQERSLVGCPSCNQLFMEKEYV